MINLNLKKAKIYQAVKLEKFPVFKLANPLKKLFLFLFVISFLIFLYGFVPENFSQETSRSLLGLLIISFTLFVLAWLNEVFFNLKLKNPELEATISDVLSNPEGFNLAEFLSFEAAKVVWQAINFCKRKKLPRIPSEVILYFSLERKPEINFIFSRVLLNLKEIKTGLKKCLDSLEGKEFQEILSDDSQKVILEALKSAQKNGHKTIEIGDILISQSQIDPIFSKNLVVANIKTQDIENLVLWVDNIKEKVKKRKRFWEYENLAKRGTLAKKWTAGYTITLDKYSNDITESIRKKDLEFVGHGKEIKIMERILSKGKFKNVLLVGEPGTGKKSMIYVLSQRSLLGKSLPEVNYKRVVELDMSTLLARIENMEEVEATLDRIFQEAVLAGNIILVIDEFHNYIGQALRLGVVDISGIITPYLRFPQFQIIAITNYEGLHRNIEKDPTILSLFGKVEVSGISQKETFTLLEHLSFALEEKHKLFISYPALSQIIYLTDRYFPSLHFPEKAIDILDEVVVYVKSSTKDKVVLPKHVEKIITEKTEIPIGEIETKERQILLNLEDLIHQRIINQEEAVKEVSTALRRARSQVTTRKGSMGCFLFLGPTGVGKTETSKALAEIYFGSDTTMIRLDMSEFQDIKDIPRLIGSPDYTGLLTMPVRENPFSLILLDEIEKANLNILNLFLQVFDEGHLTDGFGRKVSFKDTIIIATSNAGYKVILKALKKKTEWKGVKQELLDELFEKGIFRPEFINRFDAVVVFKPLTKENLLDIAQLMFANLKKNLQEKGIEFIITEPLKEKIVELGYSPVFGARELRRVIQDKVENVLASALLSQQLVKGNKVEVDQKDFKLIINPLK